MDPVTQLTVGPFSVNVTGMIIHDAKVAFRIIVTAYLKGLGRGLDDETEATLSRADEILDKNGTAARETVH